jgi:hypothetical protein
VGIEGQEWWTFALEAVGSLETVRRNFDAITHHIFVKRQSPYAFSADRSLSYPVWIGQHASQGDVRLN